MITAVAVSYVILMVLVGLACLVSSLHPPGSVRNMLLANCGFTFKWLVGLFFLLVVYGVLRAL